MSDFNRLLFTLMAGFLLLPFAVCYERVTEPVKIVHEETSYPDAMQRELMDALDGDKITHKIKLYYPKSERERAKAIADVWSIDLSKPLEIACNLKPRHRD